MTEQLTEAGMFAVDHATRRVQGILIPWGETSRTSASHTAPIRFPRGSVTVPADPSVVGLNFAHDRFRPVGRGALFTDHPQGLHAAFDIARTPEGDAWLADKGDFVKLSAEVRNITRTTDDDGTAELTGAALVTEGAFATAALFAIDDTEPAPADEDTTTEPAPADEDPETVTPTEEEEDTVAEFATIPGGRQQTAPDQPAPLTRRGFTDALFALRTAGDSTAIRPYLAASDAAGLFALTDVKYDGAGGLNAGSQLTGPQFLGELWRAVPDARTFIPAIGAGALTDMKVTGWNIDVDPDGLAEWAGNKTPIPSGPVTPTPREFYAQRFAGGNDLAREYWDFNATEVIDAYIRAMIRLYQTRTDNYALAQTVTGATTTALGAVPVGASAGLAAVLDLATEVYAQGGTPNVIRVSPTLYRELALTLDGNQFAYLSASLGITDGEVGGLSFRPDARLAANQLLVADKLGIGVWELPGSPIRVDATAIAVGGIDKGFFGYLAAGVLDPNVVLKATVPAPA